MEDTTEERVEIRAMKIAKCYYEERGWKVTNVARLGGGHAGYDLLLERNDEQRKVEVKGATTLYGIPDPYHTEFDDSRSLVADELHVVYFLQDGSRKRAIIPRDKLPTKFVVPRRGYRISGKFKNAREMGAFITEIDSGGC